MSILPEIQISNQYMLSFLDSNGTTRHLTELFKWRGCDALEKNKRKALPRHAPALSTEKQLHSMNQNAIGGEGVREPNLCPQMQATSHTSENNASHICQIRRSGE